VNDVNLPNAPCRNDTGHPFVQIADEIFSPAGLAACGFLRPVDMIRLRVFTGRSSLSFTGVNTLNLSDGER